MDEFEGNDMGFKPGEYIIYVNGSYKGNDDLNRILELMNALENSD